MKRICLFVLLLISCSLVSYASTDERLSPTPAIIGSCGATWGAVEDSAQNGIGGVTMELLKFNVLLNGWILDQTDVTDNGTGFYSFVIVNGCGTYRVRKQPGQPYGCNTKTYIHDYVDTSSVFGDQDFVCWPT